MNEILNLEYYYLFSWSIKRSILLLSAVMVINCQTENTIIKTNTNTGCIQSHQRILHQIITIFITKAITLLMQDHNTSFRAVLFISIF